MKLLELTNFSAGGCGVWHRVKHEAQLLAERGYEVRVFSSNRIKGEGGFADAEEIMDPIKIQRFPATRLGGESYMTWNKHNSLLNAIIVFNPDVIIAHSYRHTHTHIALQAKERLKCKVFLVTHAPFGRDATRNMLSRFYVNQIYDRFIGPTKLKQFDGIITIAKWEMPYLQALGVPEQQITLISNGIYDDFLSGSKPASGRKDLLYMGRISPIKQLETVIQALACVDSSMTFTMIGPAESAYKERLLQLVKALKLGERVALVDTFYERDEERAELDKHQYFILPSKSEGMPQVLIEAMARGRIVLASDMLATRELIRTDVDGYIYENGDALKLAQLLEKLTGLSTFKREQLGKQAHAKARLFAWHALIDKLEQLITRTS